MGKEKKNEIWSDLNQAACPYFNMSENDVKKWLEPDWIKLDFMFFYIILPKSDASLNTALDCKATLGVTYTLAFKYAVGGGRSQGFKTWQAKCSHNIDAYS